MKQLSDKVECPECKGIGYKGFDHITLEEHIRYLAEEEAYERKFDSIAFNENRDGLSDLDAETLDDIATKYKEKHWNKYTNFVLDQLLCHLCVGKCKVDWITGILNG